MVRTKVLIVKFGAIGDVIMAIPAVKGLHSQGAQIDWICGQSTLSLLDCYSWINAICVDDKALLRGSLLRCIASIAEVWGKIGLRSYDVCATLYYDWRYRSLTWPVKARRKVGLSRTSREAMIIPGRHHTDEYIRILLKNNDGYHEDSEGLVRPDRLPPSPWRRNQRRRAIAIVPGGASNMLRQQILRRWPVENYLQLVKRLLERGTDILLLGGPDDSWVTPYFEGLAVTDMIGRLSLPEVVSVCDECDAVVSHDTGPLHLAGLSGACLIGLFGPTDPGNFLPRRQYVVGVWGGQGFGCRPCYDGRDFASCSYNGCMHQVTPDLVLRELDLVLAAKSEGAPYPWRVVTPDISQVLVNVT